MLQLARIANDEARKIICTVTELGLGRFVQFIRFQRLVQFRTNFVAFLNATHYLIDRMLQVLAHANIDLVLQLPFSFLLTQVKLSSSVAKSEKDPRLTLLDQLNLRAPYLEEGKQLTRLLSNPLRNGSRLERKNYLIQLLVTQMAYLIEA